MAHVSSLGHDGPKEILAKRYGLGPNASWQLQEAKRLSWTNRSRRGQGSLFRSATAILRNDARVAREKLGDHTQTLIELADERTRKGVRSQERTPSWPTIPTI
jgi:hypothetical protein